MKDALNLVAKRVALGLSVFLCVATSPVQAQGSQQWGSYTVYHTVFDSSFLLPNVAEAYGLVRGNGLFLVNISVNAEGRNFGQAVGIEGTATNLMQQQQKLRFKEIDEGEATYYIAPLRIASQEVLHFAINVQPADEEPFTVKFTQTFTKE